MTRCCLFTRSVAGCGCAVANDDCGGEGYKQDDRDADSVRGFEYVVGWCVAVRCDAVARVSGCDALDYNADGHRRGGKDCMGASCIERTRWRHSDFRVEGLMGMLISLITKFLSIRQ